MRRSESHSRPVAAQANSTAIASATAGTEIASIPPATPVAPASRSAGAGAVAGPEGLSFDPAGNLYFNTRERFGTSEGAWRIDGGNPANAAVQVVPPFTVFGEGSDIVLAGPHQGALLLVDRTQRQVMISEPPGAPLRFRTGIGIGHVG